ncbi:uncharacterized protein LOC108910146 [Anoplophora glabripennis]|uniref:uncharacterized protein LOC108910146 n=1 Tax=Anoplophora glabripennis TaxID=217634 RepID=UPI00087566DF|nr:uncharacterized protein LOC108910146 [Anoplophora glabripennis]
MEDIYKKNKGNAGLEGVQFQLDLLIVFLLNALQNFRNWKISTENQEAGKYDDLVLEMPNKGVFLQAKFKQTKKITRDQLFSSSFKNSDFSLAKYFFSYLQIKSQVKEKTVILCTNTDIEEKGLENVLTLHRVGSDSLLHYEGPTCTFFTFNQNVLLDLKASIQSYLDNNLSKGIDKAVITDENMEDFLNNLQFFSNYPCGTKLHKIIEQLLSGLNDYNISSGTSHQEIYKKVEDWFKQPKGEYLTEVRAKAMFSEIRSDKYCDTLKDYNVSFERSNFNFTGSKRIFHLATEEGHLLQVLKIFHALQNDESRKLYVNPNDSVEIQKHVVESFELRSYVYLIMIWSKIENETVKSEICIKLREILERDPYKKVILVTEGNDELMELFGVNNISQIDVSITFEDLSKNTQETLKKKNVVFQGQKINLEELLEPSRNENYTKSLHSEMLQVLIKGEEIKVGVKPLELDEDTARYYVHRRFKPEVRDSRKRKNVIPEERIYDTSEKVILIIDSSGMGKSTVLIKLASVIKERRPHLWVIRINLNEYTRILRDSLRKNKKTLTVLELLNSQEATKMTNNFEELVFSINEKVLLMMDGVDEISPDYTGLVLDMLTHCQKSTNFAKIFVTTRPHVSRELKAVLNAASFKMLPFTRRNQVDFLTSYWAHNLKIDSTLTDKCKRYAETLVTKLSSWINSHHYGENLLTALPLQVKMLAEIFQKGIRWKEFMNWEGCKEYLEQDDFKPKLPEKVNIAGLYSMFIKKKQDVFTDKGNPIGNTAANQALVNQFHECLAYHRSLALKMILRETECDLFSERHADCKCTEECILKIGIVQKLGDKFQFVHRTFAEYFVADSISRELQLRNPNVEFQRLLIDQILVRPEFKVIRAFLDEFLQPVVDSLPSTIFKNYQSFVSKTVMNDNPIFVLSGESRLALLQLILKSINFKVIRGKEIDMKDWRLKIAVKSRNTLNDLKFLTRKAGMNIKNEIGDTPMHSAVKGCNLKMVKFLTEHGANVKSRNNYGGTPLHLAVVRDALDIVEYLVQHGAYVNVRNNKNLTALHLAASYGQLDIVNKLMKHSSDINCKEQYGRTALHLAAERGKIDIVKYLVQGGADVNVRDIRGCTAMQLAKERGELDTVKYLTECLKF